MINIFKIMKDLNLQFRPAAEFLLDFIHKSPSYVLEFVGYKDKFKVYRYQCSFILSRMIFTLYRVNLFDVEILVDSDSSYTELRLSFHDDTFFPPICFECTICDCGEFLSKYHYIDSDDNDE